MQYDGSSISSDLRLMSSRGYQAFGAACAEALVVDFGSTVPDHVLPQSALARMVDVCWAAVEGTGEGAADVDMEISSLDEVISSDHYEELGVGEHAVAGLYYALECVRDDDPDKAELVSGNLYEAADYIALDEAPWTVAPGTSKELSTDEHPVVRAVLKKITSLVELLVGHEVAGGGSPVAVVRLRELARFRVAG